MGRHTDRTSNQHAAAFRRASRELVVNDPFLHPSWASPSIHDLCRTASLTSAAAPTEVINTRP
jgi:hypothetical protein